MVIVETAFFTRYINELLTDDEYSSLQNFLMKRPTHGVIIKGSNGLRKMRWRASGRGKRGGARVVYYWAVRQDIILMLAAYAKNEKEDLTRSEIKLLQQIVEAEYP